MDFKIVTGTLACAMLVAGSPIQAQARNGANPYYLGFGLGAASSDEDCDNHGYDCDGNDTSFKIYGGKRLHENIAFEVSYQDLGKIRDSEGTLVTTAESEGLNLSLHAIIPLEGVGYFYGKAGYMLWNTEYTRIDGGVENSDDDGGDFTYGIGFAFEFEHKYDLRIEYERLNELGDEFVAGGDSITVFSLGGTIYFE